MFFVALAFGFLIRGRGTPDARGEREGVAANAPTDSTVTSTAAPPEH